MGGQCDFSIPHQDEMLFGTEVGALAPGHIHGRTDTRYYPDHSSLDPGDVYEAVQFVLDTRHIRRPTNAATQHL